MKKIIAAVLLSVSSLALSGCVVDNGYYDNYGHYHYYDIQHKKGNEDNKWDGVHRDHDPDDRDWDDRDRDWDHEHDRDRWHH